MNTLMICYFLVGGVVGLGERGVLPPWTFDLVGLLCGFDLSMSFILYLVVE